MEITIPSIYTIFIICSQIFIWTVGVIAIFGILAGLYEVLATSHDKKEKPILKLNNKKPFLKIYKE